MKRALISVSDKTGVVEFAKALTELITVIVNAKTMHIANISGLFVITKNFIKKHLGKFYAEVFVL